MSPCDSWFTPEWFYVPCSSVSYEVPYTPTYASDPYYVDDCYFVDYESEPSGFETGDEVDDAPQSEAEVWLHLGDVFFGQGDFKLAAEAYRKAVDLEPDSAVSRFALGEALFALGDDEGAAAQLRKGIELDPSWLDREFDRKALYPDAEVFDRRAKQVIAATEGQSFDAALVFVAGYTLYFEHRLDEAIVRFERVREIFTEDSTAELFLSRIADRAAESR